jgi:hypothetical protein
MLPNFICVGTQKAGTTTLCRLLEHHPDVFISQPRETRFFFDEERFSRGLVNYEINYFKGWNGQKAVGEKTPEYLLHPETPGRIHSLLGPDIRILITLRSPARRAFSQHRHNFSNRTETLGFREALEAEPRRTQGSFSSQSLYGYLARGRYADQVQRYLDVFEPENMLILVFEDDIVGKQEELSETVYRFVGVDPSFRVQGDVREGRPTPMQYHFIPQGKQLKIGEGQVLTGPVLLSGYSPRFVPVYSPSPGLMKHVESAMENVPAEDARLSREDELQLNQEHFAEDIGRLSDLIQRDLSHWLSDSC